MEQHQDGRWHGRTCPQHPAEWPSRPPGPGSLAAATVLVVALVAGMSASCTCDPSDVQCGADSLGNSITVITKTSGQDPDPDGYVIQVDDTQHRAANQDAVHFAGLSIETTHIVSMHDVARNCEVTSANPQSIYLVRDVVAKMDVRCISTPIFVATVTTGQSLDPEYFVRIDQVPKTNTHFSRPIGNNAAIVALEFLAGVYDLFLEDVALNCFVAAPNPRRLVLAAHDSISTTFEVECVSLGDLTVTTVTTGSDLDANGYTVTLDAQFSRPIGLNDTETFPNVAVGVHTVVLGDVASNCTVVTGVQRTVLLPIGGSASVAFGIACNAVVPLRIYTDDFTMDGNWTATVLAATGRTGHSEHVEAAGGNPGGYRWMKNDHSDPSNISITHVFNSGYDPGIEGPVSHIDYREDNILLDQGTAGTLMGAFVVVQSGVIYRADVFTISAAAWNPVSRTALTAADFVPAGLDFSASGGAMQFGYLRASSTSDAYGGDMRHGIDNWTVVVHKKLN